MKVLIINNPVPTRAHLAERRFTAMAAILVGAGINARHAEIHSITELERILEEEIPDIVYSADYYISGDNGNPLSVSSYLDEKHIPYIGSDGKTLELVLSKGRLKDKWLQNGVSTPIFHQISRSNIQLVTKTIAQEEKYPYLLKPNKEGNSRGLDEESIVYDFSSLTKKLGELLEVFDEILVEKFLGDIPGIREFTIAMIGNPGRMLLMPAEIILKTPKAHRIITTSDKDEHHTQALPVTDPSLRKELLRFSEKALLVAQVRDYARCDVLMVRDQFYAIEINGLPMIPDKWFEACASGVGLSDKQYVLAIIMAGLIRKLEKKGSRIRLTGKMIHTLPAHFWKTLCENH